MNEYTEVDGMLFPTQVIVEVMECAKRIDITNPVRFDHFYVVDGHLMIDGVRPAEWVEIMDPLVTD